MRMYRANAQQIELTGDLIRLLGQRGRRSWGFFYMLSEIVRQFLHVEHRWHLVSIFFWALVKLCAAWKNKNGQRGRRDYSPELEDLINKCKV